jgi:hypothetical protein
MRTAYVFLLAILFIGCQKGEAPDPEQKTGTVEGQVFVRTKAGTSIELGLVDVYAVNPRQLERALTVADSVSRAKVDSAAQVLGHELKELKSWHPQGLEEQGEFMDEQERVRRELKTVGVYRSPAFYLSQIRSAIDTAKTNASGKFRLAIPAGETVYLIAYTERSVGDKKERYHWVVPTQVKPDTTKRVLLSNDKMGYLIKKEGLNRQSEIKNAVFLVANSTGGALGETVDFNGSWVEAARLAILKPDSIEEQIRE